MRDKLGHGPRCGEEDSGVGNELEDGGGRQEDHQQFRRVHTKSPSLGDMELLTDGQLCGAR
jgi:hypothetical protein